MFTTEPVGRIIVLASMKEGFFKKSSLENNISNLIDLIKLRIKTKSIDEVTDNLLKDTFNIRFEVLDWLIENKTSTNEYFELINKTIAQNIQIQPYSQIAKAIAETLTIQEKILAPTLNKILPNGFEQFANVFQENKPSYETLKMLSHHPSPQFNYLPKWIDASLKFELSLIIADLVIAKEIDLTSERIENELIEFLYTTITRFGAYSIFTGFWNPEITDNTKLVNKIKILASTLFFDNKLFVKSSGEELSRLLNN